MTRRRRYWIADVLISPRVEEKLLVKHGVRRDEVEDAVRFGAYRDARWHTHERHGERLIVRGTTRGDVELMTVLVPVDEADGVWRCKTSRRIMKA
jgi:hypothetical protein